MINRLDNHIVYYFYDEPLVVGSEDAYGVKYLSVLVGAEDEASGYVVLKPSRKLFAEFVIGKTSLLDLYNHNETKFGFVEGYFDLGSPLIFKVLDRSEIKTDWYPGPRFKLYSSTNESLDIEAKLKNQVLFNLGLLAAESESELRISVDSLIDALSQFTKLRQKAWGALKRFGQLSKDSFLPVTDVTGFAPGSFKVNLSAREMPDLTGKTVSEDVLELITEILTLVENRDIDTIKAKIQQYKSPEIISSLVSISDFISKRGCPIYIEWAAPKRAYSKKIISRDSASFILNNLGHDEKLNSYYEDITGVFESASTKSGQWSLSVSKGLTVKGKTSKKLGKSALEGLVLTNKTYSLKCKFEVYFDLKKNEEVQKVELIELSAID